MCRNERGFTLMEILIAAAVIGIGLVALSAAIPIASYGISEGKSLSTATFLANQRLEQARSATWQASPCVDTLGVSASASVAPVGSCPGGVATFPDESPLPSPYDAYTRRERITSCGAGAGCNGVVSGQLRQVTVTVSYRPMTGFGMAPEGTAKPATVTMYVASR
jgi:type IV pilus assembly protein PilV